MASRNLLFAFAAAFILGGIGFVFVFPSNYVDSAVPKVSFERQRLAKENDKPGYWGERTAVFDWCEYNYQVMFS